MAVILLEAFTGDLIQSAAGLAWSAVPLAGLQGQVSSLVVVLIHSASL